MEHNIIIKQGIGDLHFDMPVEEAVALLGQADSVENIDNADDESTTVLCYEDEGLTLFFEGENPRLQCIDVCDEEATMLGENIFDLNEQEIVKLMVSHHFCEQDIEDELWGERRISFGEANVDFFFEDDTLLSVSIGK
ncbi:MAG: hypothetical protein K5650_04855 [Bacteroidales bacterium]|nr:hypothetical protein [Bacteroidales bacterium]